MPATPYKEPMAPSPEGEDGVRGPHGAWQKPSPCAKTLVQREKGYDRSKPLQARVLL